MAFLAKCPICGNPIGYAKTDAEPYFRRTWREQGLLIEVIDDDEIPESGMIQAAKCFDKKHIFPASSYA